MIETKKIIAGKLFPKSLLELFPHRIVFKMKLVENEFFCAAIFCDMLRSFFEGKPGKILMGRPHITSHIFIHTFFGDFQPPSSAYKNSKKFFERTFVVMRTIQYWTSQCWASQNWAREFLGFGSGKAPAHSRFTIRPTLSPSKIVIFQIPAPSQHQSPLPPPSPAFIPPPSPSLTDPVGFEIW